METFQIILACSLGLISVIFFIFAYRQYKEIGIPINNAYLYASKKQRAEKNFSPHYRQSAGTFFLIGLLFLLQALQAIFAFPWFVTAFSVLIILTIIFAIASYIYITKKYGF